MTGWNLPPGCTDADIDRAMGGDEECYHEAFEINWEGLATCSDCGESWWPTQQDIEHVRYCNERYDAYCRREERLERWRQVRDWFRSFLPRRRRKPSPIDDEIPF
jgi:hypothetical protein